MSKNIIITGSGGILGSILLEKLSSNSGYQVHAITSQVKRLTEEFKNKPNIHIYSSTSQIPEEIDYIVVNCAFPRVNKGKELATVFEYTESLIDELAKRSIQFFINISSQSVYSQVGDEIQTEESMVAPGSLYGMSKYAVEHLVKLKCQSHSINYTNIRLGSLASATFDQRMINRFYKMIKKQETITIDQGMPKVSYLHVEDAANALIQLSKKIFEKKEVASLYNLTNNDWMTIHDLVIAIQKYGREIGLKSTEVLFSDKISEYNNVTNSNLFYEHMKWQPDYSMKKIMKDIIDKKTES